MKIEKIRDELFAKLENLENPREILRTPELRDLAKTIPTLPPNERGNFGRKLNELKQDLTREIELRETAAADQKVEPLDITAPFDISQGSEKTAAANRVSAREHQLGRAPAGVSREERGEKATGKSAPNFSRKPTLITAENGTLHPLTRELATVLDIYTRMGFHCQENRQLDDDFHMFTSLNFPENHPARDGYDTFRTEEGFIPPAHDTAMDNRLLSQNREQLLSRGYIAEIAFGRVFRNEDADVTHDHTFYQYDGVFVSRDANLGQLLGTLRAFFETYYQQKLRIKTQPGYFPFTEPSLEFAIEKPASLGGARKFGAENGSQNDENSSRNNSQNSENLSRNGENSSRSSDENADNNSRNSSAEWLEMLGCGMLHPNVLTAAGIDPAEWRGFAWGGGLERLVMLKYGIEDLRHFESGKLAFLREFK